jgi:hypothetical protein
MRARLQAIEEKRQTFTGIFDRIGYKPGFRGSASTMTVLLKDIRDKKGKFLTPHVWLNYTKRFQELNLSWGDRIEFQARVKEYRKGSNSSIDYRLSHPTQAKNFEKVRVIT